MNVVATRSTRLKHTTWMHGVQEPVTDAEGRTCCTCSKCYAFVDHTYVNLPERLCCMCRHQARKAVPGAGGVMPDADEDTLSKVVLPPAGSAFWIKVQLPRGTVAP